MIDCRQAIVPALVLAVVTRVGVVQQEGARGRAAAAPVGRADHAPAAAPAAAPSAATAPRRRSR